MTYCTAGRPHLERERTYCTAGRAALVGHAGMTYCTAGRAALVGHACRDDLLYTAVRPTIEENLNLLCG